ncbi:MULTISPECIES: methionine ABC transporter permease [Vagococcus]|uniref:Methionine ABC transporter permease protein n=1 Tax=Vagococcus fluvialis bH819 TaxID=1255619 RepID=A0A1X6WKA2_9ENTE|nr:MULTISPECIES: methionine ABC transporter permease [Vagococcus]SLM84677.1 Methionine ABC transporter permease protein [Vagococcus fluvialis bH819]HCM89859.1 ABC transporter permease [Vagococcus sp.]
MKENIQRLLPNASKIPNEFLEATVQTIYMVFWTTLIAGILGILLGLLLIIIGPNGFLKNKWLYNTLDKIINTVRSIPFIILLTLLGVVTRFIVGTTIGETAALVPLIIGVVPFYARQIENTLLEVDPGVIEAAESMGTSPVGILFRVYLIEGLPGIVRVSAVTVINVIGFTAMAGAVGAGGLGNLAVTRGYNRFQTDITVVATLLILILVFTSQWASNKIIKKISH